MGSDGYTTPSLQVVTGALLGVLPLAMATPASASIFTTAPCGPKTRASVSSPPPPRTPPLWRKPVWPYA
eukprot:scaffold151825_cov32-Tisochrysis_lutea.AAC.3